MERFSRTDPSGLYAYWGLLEEARRRRYADPFDAAAYAWLKRYGTKCPFLNPMTPVKPMTLQDVAFLDFETFSECDLRVCGAHRYFQHPSTRVLCMSYRLPGQDPTAWIHPDAILDPGIIPLPTGQETLRPLFDWVLRDGLLEASNVEFERLAWARMVREQGWPAVHPGNWRDSMARYCAAALPRSLGNAAAALGTLERKDSAGKTLMLAMCKPASPIIGDRRDRRLHTTENVLRLSEYCLQDVKAEAEISGGLPPLSPAELEVWQTTAVINDRGIRVDSEGLGVLEDILEVAKQDWGAQVVLQTKGAITLDDLTSPKKLLEYCAALGINLVDMTKETVEAALQRPSLPPQVETVLLARQALGKTSTAKLVAIRNRLAPDNRVRGNLIYHGATTGRWTGVGVQLQNLPKECIYDVDSCLADARQVVDGQKPLTWFQMLWGDPYQAASACLRGLFCASEGSELLVADYAQIEARVVLWLAEDPGLALFAGGKDIYKEMAAQIYKRPAAEIQKPSKERDLGKETVLGGGFQMGANKFYERCQQKGIIISPEEAKACIDGYRRQFPGVVRLWRELQRVAVTAVKNPKSVFCYKKLAYCSDGKTLRCKLPSGRKLCYPEAQVSVQTVPWSDSEVSETVSYMSESIYGWKREGSYGGKLTENATQAVARDILAEAIQRVEACGWPVVLTVHDEIICEMPAGKVSVKQFEATVGQAPDWAAGLPVKAEGWAGRRYRK